MEFQLSLIYLIYSTNVAITFLGCDKQYLGQPGNVMSPVAWGQYRTTRLTFSIKAITVTNKAKLLTKTCEKTTISLLRIRKLV